MLFKKLIYFLLAFGASVDIAAQVYAANNFSLLSVINPETGANQFGSKYSACWGWTQPGTNKEYAIACSKSGTYWVDVTNPYSPTVCAFAAGTSSNGVWRETKTYQNYCYVACDDNSSSGFQIFDMSTLPGTVTLVSQNQSLFRKGHTLWIDGNKLYVASVTYSNNSTSSMNVYSLATPTAPVLLRRLNQDYSFINSVHDMYVRNDTVFASCGYQGLHVFKFNSGSNTFTQLGSLTTYSGSGYNHSSALTPDGKTLVFTDEVPTGLPIKVADVTNLGNIQVLATTNQNPQTTPHNPFMVNNKYCFMSSYLDGTQLYDISNPSSPILAGYFDTYPQAGSNNNNWAGDNYNGQWGCYPYFESRNVFALDQKNGIFMIKSHLFQNPIADFFSDEVLCAGANLNITNTSTAATSYTWNLPGGNPPVSNAANPVVSYSAAGIYSIQLIAANNTSSSTATHTISVHSLSSALNFTNATCGVCSDGAILITPFGGTSPYTYSWQPSGGNAALANNLYPGCYTVTIEDANACSTNTTSCIGFPSMIEEKNALYAFDIFPNPAENKIHIRSHTADEAHFKIMNSLGQIVLNKNLSGVVDEEIELNNFADGIYIITINTISQTLTKKLIIKNL